jgi:hypothetical protein
MNECRGRLPKDVIPSTHVAVFTIHSRFEEEAKLGSIRPRGPRYGIYSGDKGPMIPDRHVLQKLYSFSIKHAWQQ